MRKRPLWLATILACCVSAPARSQDGIYVWPGVSATPLSGSHDVGCDKGCIQAWYFNHDDQQRAVMTGYLLARKINNGHDWDDWDYNLCIQPDANYTYLSYNWEGDRTPAREACGKHVPLGVVEGEVKPSAIPFDWVSTNFPENTAVTAFGWWVHDKGHPEEDYPSELHPLIWMAEQGPLQTLHLMAAQDQTGRFSLSWLPINEEVDVIYSPAERPIIGAGDRVVPVNALREKAEAQQMGANVAADHVALAIWLPAPCSIIQAWPVCLSGSQFAYHSILQHTKPDLLHETVVVGVQTDLATGLKSGTATVTLALDSPPGTALNFVSWDWLNNPAGQPQPLVQHQGPFTQTFTLTYAPRDGVFQHDWALDISGATVPPAQLASSQRPLDSADNFGYDRTFVGVQRQYHVDPSQISIATDQPVLSRPTQQGCPLQQTVRLNTAKLFPGTTLPSSQWSIQLESDPTGTWHELSATNQYRFSSSTFVAEADPTDPTKLVLTTQTDPAHPGQGLSDWANVSVVTATDIGEWLVDAIEVSSLCQSTFHLPVPQKAGYIPWYRWPGPDPRIQNLLVAKGYPLDMEGLPERVKAADRRWISAYIMWTRGGRLSANERLEVEKALSGAAALRAPVAPRTRRAANAGARTNPSPSLRRPLTQRARFAPTPVLTRNTPAIGMECPGRAVGLLIQTKALALQCTATPGGAPRWQRK